MNIGDLILRLLADGSTLTPSVVKEAAKAGDAGGKTLGQSLGASLKTYGTKALAVGGAALAAVLTKSAVEMENLQARIMSETGATADEADRIADSATKIAGKYRMALDVVGDIAIRVKRDLGLVGEEADAATDRIAAFARVTGMGAAAVSKFDDVLDSYELTADQLGDVQDRLLTQWQRTGGDIGEMTDALAAMAPQLKAFNLGWEDGVAILGLANDAGISATDIQKGLNAAIAKVPPGTSFDDILARLSAIEDDGERAREAIEIFGTRAGTKLANAIKPGVDSLDAWAIAQDEAAGATERANDALDSTPIGRIKKFFSELTAGAKVAADEFGSLFSAAASAALIGSSLGLGGPAKAALKALGGKIMAAIGVGMVGNAASGVVVDGVTSAVGSSGVKGALMAAGAKAGGILSAAIGAGIAAAPFAIVAAIAAAIALAFKAVVLDPGLQQQSRDIGAGVGEQIVTGTREQLEQSKAALEKGIADIKSLPLGDILYGDQIRDLEASHAAVVARLEEMGEDLPTALADGIMHDRGSVPAAVDQIVEDGAGRIRSGSWEAAGEAIPEAIGEGVLRRQGMVRDAFDKLKNLMDNVMTKMEEVAYLKGIRTSKRLERALRDGRPAVRAQAQAVLEDWEQRMTGLIKSGGKGGEKAQRELSRALKSNIPEVRAAAERVKNAVGDQFEKLPAIANREGKAALRALRAALRGDGQTFVIGAGVTVRLGIDAPGKALGGPVQAGHMYRVNENTPHSEFWVPEVDGRVLTEAQGIAAMSGSGPSGGDTVNVTVPITGVLRAETPGEVGARLRQVAAGGLIQNPRRRHKVEVPSRG